MKFFKIFCIFAFLGVFLTGGYTQTNLVGFDEAMTGAAAAVEAKVPRGYEIAFAEFTAPLPTISKFLNDELDQRFSNTGKLTVLARGRIQQNVSMEQKFQLSGLVDDNSAVSIGNQLGAKAVITGTFERYNDFSQFRLRVVEVRTARILAAYSARIRSNDPVLVSITKPLQNIKAPAITENVLDCLNRGKDYYAEGKYDQAIAEFTKALGINQELSDAYYYRGCAYYYKKDDDRAIADYTAALRINPNHAYAYNNRGVAYQNGKGDYDRAIADYTAALRFNPNDADIYYNRGSAYYNKGDYDRAIADISEALRITPNDAAAYYNRGLAYMYGKKDYDHAIADFTEALRITPYFALAYNNRGNGYYNKGDYDRAIGDFTEALRIDPNFADAKDNLSKAYFFRGLAYFNKNDYDRAIGDFTEVLRIDPKDDHNKAQTYFNRGKAYGMKDDYGPAIADLTEANRLDPSNQDYQLILRVLLELEARSRKQ